MNPPAQETPQAAQREAARNEAKVPTPSTAAAPRSSPTAVAALQPTPTAAAPGAARPNFAVADDAATAAGPRPVPIATAAAPADTASPQPMPTPAAGRRRTPIAAAAAGGTAQPDFAASASVDDAASAVTTAIAAAPQPMPTTAATLAARPSLTSLSLVSSAAATAPASRETVARAAYAVDSFSFHRPADLAEALRLLADRPDAVPIAGGTDLMVTVNYRLARPAAMLDLTGLAELREWADEGDAIRIGSGVPYSRIVAELATVLPGLAAASRTVGSPQIRNRGTLGGNLATASPAGDGHPPLLATGATVEIASAARTRTVPIAEFFLGPKRSALLPGELITAVLVPKATGPQQFLKVGTRNAMVIAVCSLAVTLDLDTRRLGTGIGSAGPTPLTAPDADRIELPWSRPALFNDALAEEFGRRVAAAARPIDDVRGTADYRRHALAVCAARALRRVWTAAHEERTT
jgi:CO/xanthine dehydrogenase FAD-binding subunit